MIVSQNNLAALAFELGDARRGARRLARGAARGRGDRRAAARALILTNLGELALVENKLDEARSRLENALEIIEDIEDRGLETECCRHLATLEKQQGHAARAPASSPSARSRSRRRPACARRRRRRCSTLGDVLST